MVAYQSLAEKTAANTIVKWWKEAEHTSDIAVVAVVC